jgi:hypothetical protein
MPNYCTNYLVVGGPARERKLLLETFKDTPDKEFKNMFPAPTAEDPAKQVDTQIAWWGSKWGDFETVLSQETGKQFMWYFSSAWNPPDRLIQKVSKKYPKLVFGLGFYEPGMGFAGAYLFKDGEQIDDEWISCEPPDGDNEDFDEWYEEMDNECLTAAREMVADNTK